MKLGPRQVRLVTPFWPTLFGRTLRFTGRRNTVQLQETALVAEGELLLFPCLGLERLFGRALSAWSTVTVPYSRIVAVRYRPRRVLRVGILVLLLALSAATLQLLRVDPAEWTWLDAAADALILVPFVALACIVWWRVPPTYTVRFRAKDGKRTRFHFTVRSRAARRQFDDALAQYRQASQAFARVGAGR